MDLAKNPHTERAFGSPDILQGNFFSLCPYVIAISKTCIRWIAEMAYSHEYLESLDGFPGCEDVDCLLRIATTQVQEVNRVCTLRNNVSTNPA